MLEFQGTVKSSGEEVVMKLEDPNNQHKVCFLPQEVQVYEDLQKSEVRSFLSSKFDHCKFIFLQEHQTFWRKVSQTFTIMVFIKEKGHW